MNLRIDLLGFLLISALTATGADKEGWVNLPGTPLKFSLLANRYTLSLTNVSKKVIRKHTLGCVKTPTQSIHKLRKVTVTLEPGKSSFGNLDSYQKDLAACQASDSALAVVNVTFTDGEVWKAKSRR
jgi:hypothetical protein